MIAVAAMAGSLLFSSLALWKACENEDVTYAANVQIASLEGKSNINLYSGEQADELRVSGSVKLKNYGRAATEIVEVEWEPLVAGGSENVTGMWLAFYDDLDESLGEKVGQFYVNRDNPVLSVHWKTIRPGQNRTFYMDFFGEGQFEQAGDPNVRVTLTFSNGQALSFLPDITWSVIAGMEPATPVI